MNDKDFKLYFLSIKDSVEFNSFDAIIIDILSNHKIKSHRYYLYVNDFMIRINSIKRFLDHLSNLDCDVQIAQLREEEENHYLKQLAEFSDLLKNDNSVSSESYNEGKVSLSLLNLGYYISEKVLGNVSMEREYSPLSQEDKEKVSHYFHGVNRI